MLKSLPRLAALFGTLGVLTACSGDSAGPTTGAQVTFNLAVGTAGSAVRGLLSDTLTDASNTLVLDSVQLVLRDIRFKRVEDSACDGDEDESESGSLFALSRHDDSMSSGDGDGHDGHADGCESFNARPYLLDLPLDSTVEKAFAVAVDTGTYDQVRIKLHKPSHSGGDPKDAQFLANHPEFDGVSVRVVGSFNGTPFVFVQDIEAEQRMDFVPALVVADSATNINVTLKVDLAGWFRDGAGSLVDPSTANKGGANDSLVRDNIKDSFRAFRDDDCDGEDEPGDD